MLRFVPYGFSARLRWHPPLTCGDISFQTPFVSSSERITELTAELNDGNSKIEEMKAEFNQIVSWSKIFDDSPMEVKKMICGYIIKKVSVCKDYDIKIEFNINVEQFLNGIDGVSECDTSELSIAQ